MGPCYSLTGSDGTSVWVSLASSSFCLLCQNNVVLVAITCARRVSELQALMAESPYKQFSKDKVTLWQHPQFLSNVVSPGLNETEMYLPVFCPKPHSTPAEQHLHSGHTPLKGCKLILPECRLRQCPILKCHLKTAICRAGIWSVVHTCANYYAITAASRADANFGKAVLQSLFN